MGSVFWAAVVAQWWRTLLVTERLWVRIPQGAGLFSLLFPLSSASLIQVPRGGATLLIFLQKICRAMQLEAKQA